MRQSSGQSGSSGAIPLSDARPGPPAPTLERPAPLALETTLVTIGILATIKAIDGQSVSGLRWLLVPSALVAAAMIPTWLGRREFPRIWFDPERFGLTVRLVGAASVLVVLVALFSVWLMTHLNLPIPLKPTITGRADWLAWLLYQFLYVAVAEEVFFRGYVQANVARVLRRMKRSPAGSPPSIAIVVSAACFAIAHVIVQGRPIAVLTFLPGLLLAWAFAHTRSLLAPILLHGLANITYGVIALNLA